MFTVKVALYDPAGTVTLEGIDSRLGSLVVRLTAAPPLGATVLSVAVSVTELPPPTVVGEGVSESRMGGGAGTSTLLLDAFWMNSVTS